MIADSGHDVCSFSCLHLKFVCQPQPINLSKGIQRRAMLNLPDVKYVPNGHCLQLSLLCRGLEGPTRANPPSVGNTPTESQDHARWASGCCSPHVTVTRLIDHMHSGKMFIGQSCTAQCASLVERLVRNPSWALCADNESQSRALICLTWAFSTNSHQIYCHVCRHIQPAILGGDMHRRSRGILSQDATYDWAGEKEGGGSRTQITHPRMSPF